MGVGFARKVKGALWAALHRGGFLSRWHQWRNRETLTVVLFHQVLPFPARQPGGTWPGCAVTPGFFEECLEFFSAHYHIVTLDQVVSALDATSKLPSCALLITFDDGWKDTLEQAYPILARHQAPAVLFAIGRLGDGREMWHEPVIRAWLSGSVDMQKWVDFWRVTFGGRPAPTPFRLDDLHKLLAELDGHDDTERASMVAPLGVEPPSPDVMMNQAQLRAFANPPNAVGGHGWSHLPFTALDDPQREFDLSRQHIASALDKSPMAIKTMSWPHGRYTQELVRMAHAAGYECLFTSDQVLNPTKAGKPPEVLGRFEPGMSYLADNEGHLLRERLASLLFRLPIRALGIE